MKIRKILLIAILAIATSFVCNELTSQSIQNHKIEKLDGSLFKHGTKLNRLHKFEEIFATNPESHVYFKKFDRNRVKAKRWGFVSLGLIAVSPILNTRVLPDGNVDPEPGFLLAVLASSSFAIITGSAAIIFKLKSNDAMSKALSIYNEDISHLIPQKSETVPSVVFNYQGIGLAISF